MWIHFASVACSNLRSVKDTNYFCNLKLIFFTDDFSIDSTKLPEIERTQIPFTNEEIKADPSRPGKYEKQEYATSDTSDELTLSLDEMESEDDDVMEIPADNNNMQISATSLRNNFIARSLPSGLSDRPSAMKRLRYREKRDSSDSVFAPITPQSSVDDFVSEKNKKNRTDLTNERLTVYIAQYTYDPFKHSPNENPALELALEAGDYIYVFGDADEVSVVVIVHFTVLTWSTWHESRKV